MKRNYHRFPSYSTGDQVSGGDGGNGGESGMAAVKTATSKENQNSGLDELLDVLGYKVRKSDMAEVVNKLEQLEEVMGSSSLEGLSHIATQTVHYNPSDISGWIGTMLSELNPGITPAPEVSILPPGKSSSITSTDHDLSFFEDPSYDYDLKAIPGRAVFCASTEEASSKRLKRADISSSPSSSWSFTESVHHPLMVGDSQENGIRLVHSLTACAEAVQQEDLQLAEVLVKKIRVLTAAQIGAMGKVATYFAEALTRRIYHLYYPQNRRDDLAFGDALQMHFYDTCPYLKFAHFTANQAILESFDGKPHVHVIDFSMNQGMQWPALMQAFALRAGGPPSFRLTSIESGGNSGAGIQLAQFAEAMNIEFNYEGINVTSLSDLAGPMLEIRQDVTVAVNSVFELHRWLARPGAMEKVLTLMNRLKPEIFTVVEQEANHNGPIFLDRFMESLHYYSTLFDSLEGCGQSDPDRTMSEMYLGQQICNIVACEGPDRVERHESLVHWKNRFASAGFVQYSLGSDAFNQASRLLDVFEGGGDAGYRVEEHGGSLMLAWHTRPLIAASAWRPVRPDENQVNR